MGCGGSGSGSSAPTQPVTPTPSGPASGSEFLYAFFGSNARVAPIDPTTGAIGPTTDAAPNISPVIENGMAVQYRNFIYVIGFDQLYASLGLWKFSITGAHGELTLSDDSPMAIGGGDPLLDSVHSRLYVAGVTIQEGGGQAFDLSGYTLNPQTGTFTGGIGYTEEIPAGTFLAPAIDPLGRFIYEIAATPAGDAIFVYLIDPSTGGLSKAAGSPYIFPTLSGVEYSTMELLPSPSGEFLYAYMSGSANNIYVFSVNSTTGALTPIAGSPFATDINLGAAMAIDPAGNALYAQERVPATGDVMQTFPLDPVHGAVGTTALSTYSFSGNFFGDSTVDPSGNVLISANQVATPGVSVFSFTINPTTGIPTPASGSPFNMSANSAGTYESFQSYLVVKIP